MERAKASSLCLLQHGSPSLAETERPQILHTQPDSFIPLCNNDATTKPEHHPTSSIAPSHLPGHEQSPALGHERRHRVAEGPAAGRSRYARWQELPLSPKHLEQAVHSLFWGERRPRSSGSRAHGPSSPAPALGGRREPYGAAVRRRTRTRARTSSRRASPAGQRGRGLDGAILVQAIFHALEVRRRRQSRSCWQRAITPYLPLVFGHGLKRHAVLLWLGCCPSRR